MEKKKIPLFIAAAAAILLSGFLSRNPRSSQPGQIYLYGEVHAHETIQNMELERWEQYYKEDGMRHLFMETSYCHAQFLNLWMQSDNNEILDSLLKKMQGTYGGSAEKRAFYLSIKENCPETVFHGTDIGHQYSTIGQEYLYYLEENGQKDSEEYQLAKKNIQQGKTFEATGKSSYRENCMAENFIEEYDRLIQSEGPTDIMGIYGAAHTNPDIQDVTGEVPSMASQIQSRYGESLHSKDLREELRPLRTERIELNGKEYQASYFGELSVISKEIRSMRFWHLEEAYDDVNACPTNGNVLPDSSFLIPIPTGQVYAIDFTQTNGQVIRKFFRTDGNTFQGAPCAEEFLPE